VPGLQGARRSALRLSLCCTALLACSPYSPEAGSIQGPGHAKTDVLARAAQHRPETALPARKVDKTEEQILFGDLHVHSTFSVDAYMYSLPMWAGGEGAHPPADACDFARWCSGLDFFAMTDHAEGLTPDLWAKTRRMIRECNARAGDPAAPDLVAFLGFEWTQAGKTPETHFGHKNVIFPGLADDELPARPISAVPTTGQSRPPGLVMQGAAGALRLAGLGVYGDLLSYLGGMADIPDCPADIPSPQLPPDCRENAQTPAELFRKLDEWGLPSLVIPHGLAWGIHAPPGARLDLQLNRTQHDPARQRLLEIASGHGNSEEYRSSMEAVVDSTGDLVCPEPTPDFLPCCWQAGEIQRSRCGDLPQRECEKRVVEARHNALRAGAHPTWVFPDASPEEWLDCDQCRDCFKPARSLRPRETAQYAEAIGNFAEPEPDGSPLRFRFGFVASTDNHASRAGTGYKQSERRFMTDSHGFTSQAVEERVLSHAMPAVRDPSRSLAVPETGQIGRLRGLFDTERTASFLYPGGIVGVHSAGRSRTAIWNALERREVYGTSGPRILLWFDLLNAPHGPAPMGSEVHLHETPHFEVRAIGAWIQKPGCPDEARQALSPERLHRLCRDECYQPGDRRHPIAAIEVVRIRPQQHPGEPVAQLIEDPWRRFPCAPDPEGCRIDFDDPDFVTGERSSVYYVRALQEPTPAINGANLRARRDADGNTLSVEPCFGGWRTPASDACLAPVNERAWSSPIYLEPGRG